VVGAADGTEVMVGMEELSPIMAETVGSAVGVEIVTKTGERVELSPRSVVGWRMVTVDGANVGTAPLSKDVGALVEMAAAVGVKVGKTSGGTEGLGVGSSVGLLVDALLPAHPHSAMGASEMLHPVSRIQL
jgi:hypothetical protein